MIDKQSLQNELSEHIERLGSLIEDIILKPYSLHISRMRYPRSTYNYRLRKFSKLGLVKKQNTKKYGNTFVLTDKGRSLLHKPKNTEKRSDNLSTIILFDIPEEKRRERNIFRRYLLRNGYVLIQKSFLIAPYKISTETREVIRELRLSPYIKFISGRIDYL